MGSVGDAYDNAGAKTWKKANPNLGVPAKVEYLERERSRAKEAPAYLNTFLRLHLNIRPNADIAAMDVKQSEACASEVPSSTVGRYFRSKRSRFMTLFQATTKSRTSFSLASSCA